MGVVKGRTEMTIEEARELVNGPMWTRVRDSFLATGEFAVHPTGDLRRLDYLDAETRARIAEWKDALLHVDSFRVLDGAKARELRKTYPTAYPEALRFAPYFARFGGEFTDAAMRLLLKLKFPEALALVDS